MKVLTRRKQCDYILEVELEVVEVVEAPSVLLGSSLQASFYESS